MRGLIRELNMNKMNDIRKLSSQEISDFLLSIHEKSFRKDQIYEWIWKKGVCHFDEMINLSKLLIGKLQENFSLHKIVIKDEVQSNDLSTKFIFELEDAKAIEGVLIPSDHRVTACISSQVGCPLGCQFCATGTMGFVRHLHFSEIIDQYELMNKKSMELYDQPISNIVFMGMGEPLLNYDNVMTAISILTSPKAKALSPSRITLSTVGIVDGIIKLADSNFKAGLAVSLHIPNNNLRSSIMPVNVANPLPKLQEALRYYFKKTGERVTIEYVLLKHINDSLEDADRLLKFCKPFPVKINLIEYNATDSGFEKSPLVQEKNFKAYLEEKNMVVYVRKSRGKDIAAACGQLVKESDKKNLS